MSGTVSIDRAEAARRDAADPLRAFRAEFVIPPHTDGNPARYFCGNSLGLMPRRAPDRVAAELEAWGSLGVRGHHEGTGWYRYHERFRESLARLAGAEEREVVLMNSLTVNLHLLMVSFYRPTPGRHRILVEDAVFPSDLYALQTQIRYHGHDPATSLVHLSPRPGETHLRTEDIEERLEREGSGIALVLIGGVSFLTGQWFDIPRIVRAAHRAGARIGVDLAHGMGNVPLSLHDWGVDFAVWCSYKYLNGSPGALGGAYVHADHVGDRALPRFGGWWGNDPDTRFRMQLEAEFVPVAAADGWQLSNPAILGMAPLRASLDLFDRAGMDALRAKSVELTGYLEAQLRARAPRRVGITTPSDPAGRGCQLSLRIREGARATQKDLERRGFVCDFREPDILRVAPVPLYNTYDDAWALADALADGAGA